MSQQTLSLETIGALDGGHAGEAINTCIREALRDLDDRGKDGKARKVNITIEFVKTPKEQVEIAVEASWSGPKLRTYPTVANVRQDGKGFVKLLFQEHAPEDPDQKTLDEVEGRAGE